MKYIQYTVAAIIGLFSRTMAAYSIGWTTYRINGRDILVAVLCMVMVWCVRSMFVPAPKKRKSRSSKHDH